jgi:hypothetical protein
MWDLQIVHSRRCATEGILLMPIETILLYHVQNVFEGVAASGSGVERYIIILKLLNSVFNIRTEPKSPYQISCWTYRTFLW